MREGAVGRNPGAVRRSALRSNPRPVRESAVSEVRTRALTVRWSALVATLGLLHLCGRGALARPSLRDLLARPAAADPRPAIETAMAVIRLGALGAGGYLLLVVTVALVGRSIRHRPTILLATRFTPPGLRAILALATTASLAVGFTAGTAEAARTAQPPGPPRSGPAPASSTPTATRPPALRWVAPATEAPPTLRWTGPPSRGVTAPPARAGTQPAGSAPPAPRDAGPVPAHGTGRSPRPTPTAVRRLATGQVGRTAYTIRPGDNFWSIAASQVGSNEPVSRTADERVAQYWQLLVQANRHNLPVPGHPDLLFPGDHIVLPPVP